MDKDNSEIVKLTERISKDPKSKLFVPLAEEYKKIGDIEMAIHVLSEGLKKNPSYVTARSMLGRLLYENGDLVAAQKEFEEVVNAIPDNLLAQKKLGDLYSLQNNHTEALKHYKIALALNPDDKSCATLVSRLEENLGLKEEVGGKKGPLGPIFGPDMKLARPAAPDISMPSVQSQRTSSEATKEQQPRDEIVPNLKPEPSVGAVELTKEKSTETSVQQDQVSEPHYEAPPLSPIPVKENMSAETERVLDSSDVHSETEEPEEVFAVEPIEDDETPEEPFSAEKSFTDENIFEDRHWNEKTAKTDKSIFEHELQNNRSELHAKQELEVTVTPSTTQGTFGATDAKVFEPKPYKQTSDESDDFTTDTLAELYIAQGFYEKAIDIYERMMADHPDNRGLKEKLDRVREMALVNPPEEYASAVVQSFEALGEKIDSSISEEPKEYTSPQEISEKTDEQITVEGSGEIEDSATPSGDQVATLLEDDKKTSTISQFETYLEAEHKEDVAAVPIKENIEPENIFNEAKEFKPRTNLDKLNRDVTEEPTIDFKLREDTPLDTSLDDTGVEKDKSTPLQSIKAKKDTIDRLETWLRNIKKEK
jgi:tetratricopeptide (TPR) repeat protein